MAESLPADTAAANRPPADSGLLPRTYFKAPRVPLDLRALFLALVGYGIFRLGDYLLNQMFDKVSPVGSFFAEVLGVLRLPYLSDGAGSGELPTFVRIFLVGNHRLASNGGFWADLVGGVCAARGGQCGDVAGDQSRLADRRPGVVLPGRGAARTARHPHRASRRQGRAEGDRPGPRPAPGERGRSGGTRGH